MKEPLYTTRPSMPSYEEYTEMLHTIWDKQWMTNMGELHERLEAELKTFLQSDGVMLFVNGHMALELAIQAILADAPQGSEVITTPFTFVSTTHAIARNRLTPVFCDIRESDCTIDPDKIEALITDKTVAIVPVHVYGNICDVKAIAEIAKKHNLKVIYDAAHAFGESFEGTPVGNFGDASMFSFHATKVYNSIEGGCVVYRALSEEELAQNPEAVDIGRRMYNLKNFGIRDEDIIESIGANAKMNEFQAAMGLCNLKHLSEYIANRRVISEHYMEKLSRIPGIRLNPVAPGVKSNYAYFPIFVDSEVFGCDRDRLQAELKKEQIFARKYFYPLTNEIDCYTGIIDCGSTPIAHRMSRCVMTLPLASNMTLEEADRVCDAIAACYQALHA